MLKPKSSKYGFKLSNQKNDDSLAGVFARSKRKSREPVSLAPVGKHGESKKAEARPKGGAGKRS